MNCVQDTRLVLNGTDTSVKVQQKGTGVGVGAEVGVEYHRVISKTSPVAVTNLPRNYT